LRNEEVSTDYVIIAEAINSIRVEAVTTNIRAGLQFVPTGNFSIIENIAGGLLESEEVWITVTDHHFTEMQIAQGFNWAITQGDLEITTPRVGTPAVGGVWAGGQARNIIFEVTTASTVASRIDFTNVQIRLAAMVPHSTEGYDILVWGPAVARNVEWVQQWELGGSWVNENEFLRQADAIQDGNVNPRDLFTRLGFYAHYLTAGAGFAMGLVDEIVTISAGNITVGGQNLAFDADRFGVPHVNADGVGVLPARLSLSVLFGADPMDAELFIWDAATSTIFVDPEGHDIQMTVGSNVMRVGGAPRNMLDGGGNPTVAYVDPALERMFVPTRAIAEAVGFDVQWDAATATVTLIPPNLQ